MNNLVNTTYPDTPVTELDARKELRSSGAPALTGSVRRIRDLMLELVGRNLKIMYKRSFLGIAWSLITPLLQLLTYSFLFYGVIGLREANYASMALTGLLCWHWFSSSLINSSQCITGNSFYLTSARFPTAILPPVVVTTWLIHFLIATPALFAVYCLNGVHLGATAFLFPVIVVLQFAFTVALAYPLAALNVTFRDTQHILTIVLNLAFVLTPVFYSASRVPESLKWLVYLNPMAQFVEAYRSVLLRGSQPDWTALLAITLLTMLLMLPVGYWFFQRQRFKFAEEL